MYIYLNKPNIYNIHTYRCSQTPALRPGCARSLARPLSLQPCPPSCRWSSSSTLTGDLPLPLPFDRCPPPLPLPFDLAFGRSATASCVCRYDLNGNGILDSHKELTQLVTNLAFALKLGSGLSKLLEQACVCVCV